jgi:hypothetical protein
LNDIWCNPKKQGLDGKEKSSKFKARKSPAMMLTWRTLKQLGMQRNKEFGVFTKPSRL